MESKKKNNIIIITLVVIIALLICAQIMTICYFNFLAPDRYRYSTMEPLDGYDLDYENLIIFNDLDDSKDKEADGQMQTDEIENDDVDNEADDEELDDKESDRIDKIDDSGLGNLANSIKKINKNQSLIYFVEKKNFNDWGDDANIPQINLDYDGIKNLNSQLLNYQSFYPRTLYYINGEVLSLLLHYFQPSGNGFHVVFNIDVTNGNILTNEELLIKYGNDYNVEDLSEKINTIVSDTIKKHVPEDQYFQGYRESSKNYNYFNGSKIDVPLFINRQGKLSMIVTYWYPVGGDGPAFDTIVEIN